MYWKEHKKACEHEYSVNDSIQCVFVPEQCLAYESLTDYIKDGGMTKSEKPKKASYYKNTTVFGACRAKEQCLKECGKLPIDN